MAALAMLVAWLGVLCWQALEYRAAVRGHRESLRRTGEASIGMLEAAIRSMGRGRRERPEFLELVLSEVIAAPYVKGARLELPDGTVLASAGEAGALSAPHDVSAPVWLADGVIVGRRIDTGPCYIGGSRRSGPAAFESRPADLYLLLDRTDYDLEVRAHLTQRVIVLGAFAVALMGAFMFVAARAGTRRLQQELAVAEERSRQHREWALLGAGLAHETKNPLSVVRGLAQRLADEDETSPARTQAAGQLVEEVDRVVARIEEFLQFARPAEPRMEAVDIRRLLEDMGALIQADLMPRQGRVTIEAEPLTVRADGAMFRQILLNLLVNAAHAIGPGGTIVLRAGPGPGGTAAVEVRDDGRGIPADEIDKIFQPYYTRTPGGTGLGLAIVRRLVEAHGWRIEAQSEPNAGTAVRISGIART